MSYYTHQIAESLSILGLFRENEIGDECIITGLFGKHKEEQRGGCILRGWPSD